MEQLYSPTFDQPEKPFKRSSVEEVSSPITEFVPKFTHVQEDLKYMFQIDVESEVELHSEEIKQKIYTRAIDDLCAGNPFSLEHFAEYDLLSPSDIKNEDMPRIKTGAINILKTYKHTARIAASKNLFLKMGILTEEETKNSF